MQGRAIVASAAVLITLSCGLPQTVFLARPVQTGVTELPAAVTLQHDTENDTDSFSGYEIYYKFYDPTSYISEFATNRTEIENALPSQVLAALANQGFLRAYRSDGTDTRPSVPVAVADKGEAFEMELTFAPTAVADIPATVSWDATAPVELTILRDQDQLQNPDPPLGFEPQDLTPTDPEENLDMPDGIPLTDPLRMAVAVLAYGIDFTTGQFSPVYSQATVIDSTLQINFQ